MRRCAGAAPLEWSCSQQDLVLQGSPFKCALYVASWVELWYGLKSTAGCIGSRSTWVEFSYRSILDIVCSWPWATCLELLYCSLSLLHILKLE